MFDDVLNATTLVGVGAVIAAVFISAAGDLAPAAADPVAKAPAADAKAAVTMPVYELPRVVVVGNRSRDGDRVAVSEPALPAPAIEPTR